MAKITTTIKLMTGQKLKLGGPPSFQRRQMLALTIHANERNKRRIQAAIGSDDLTAKPITRRYAIRKSRAGKGNTRNLTFTGDMLANQTVRYADAKQGRIDITKSKERIKAKANEKRSPWFGFSTSDIAAIVKEAREEFRETITSFRTKIRGGKTTGWV